MPTKQKKASTKKPSLSPEQAQERINQLGPMAEAVSSFRNCEQKLNSETIQYRWEATRRLSEAIINPRTTELLNPKEDVIDLAAKAMGYHRSSLIAHLQVYRTWTQQDQIDRFVTRNNESRSPGRMTWTHLTRLAQMANHEHRNKLIDRVYNEEMTVEDVAIEVRRATVKPKAKGAGRPPNPPKDMLSALIQEVEALTAFTNKAGLWLEHGLKEVLECAPERITPEISQKIEELSAKLDQVSRDIEIHSRTVGDAKERIRSVTLRRKGGERPHMSAVA